MQIINTVLLTAANRWKQSSTLILSSDLGNFVFTALMIRFVKDIESDELDIRNGVNICDEICFNTNPRMMMILKIPQTTVKKDIILLYGLQYETNWWEIGIRVQYHTYISIIM